MMSHAYAQKSREGKRQRTLDDAPPARRHRLELVKRRPEFCRRPGTRVLDRPFGATVNANENQSRHETLVFSVNLCHLIAVRQHVDVQRRTIQSSSTIGGQKYRGCPLRS
jgi:hypothetical protein